MCLFAEQIIKIFLTAGIIKALRGSFSNAHRGKNHKQRIEDSLTGWKDSSVGASRRVLTA